MILIIKIKFKMQGHSRTIAEKAKDLLKMEDIVLDFRRVLVIDPHANTSMK
jgi:hypothetical protein